jgi:hypothetical protein
MLSTVPTIIPEKRILFPTCNPLIFLKVEVSLKTGLNRFFCFPIKNMARKKSIEPTAINNPNLTLNFSV